jgi:biotin synthase
MKEAGANGVLFRFETSNQKLYGKLHPRNTLKGDFKNRLKLIEEMKKMGYYISSGLIIGLPGQTIDNLADDLLMIKKLNVGMVSMGPFIPCDNTPLENKKHGSLELALKMIAVSRLVMPKSRIPVTTAYETLDPKNARKRGLQSGANSLMFNLTPAKYRSKYKIYPNKFYGRDKDLEDFALYQGKESWEMLEREFKKYL